ncbi:MAG: hypothetical protein M3Y24_00935, partial [Acidobacteriota bacterium]|nr:hypothetical protein [Acidobacteriota bacterium]
MHVNELSNARISQRGIGLASAVFTLLWQAIYAQLPVPEPLGLKAAMGRMIRYPNDQISEKRLTAVLSYNFWQEAYGGQVSAWNTVLRDHQRQRTDYCGLEWHRGDTG